MFLSRLCSLSAAMAPFATLGAYVLTLAGIYPAATIVGLIACVLGLIGESGKWFGN